MWRYFLGVFLTFFIMSCGDTLSLKSAHSTVAEIDKATCDWQKNKSCSQSSFIYTLSDYPVQVESKQRIFIQGLAPKKEFQVSGYIEGVNMYMGRIPLQFARLDNGDFVADFYLGACSEPKMTWNLHTIVTHADGTIEEQDLAFESQFEY